MIRVHVLHESYYCQNGIAFRFPLWKNRLRLRDHGIDIRFFTTITPELFCCDSLVLVSRFFSTWWDEQYRERLFLFLKHARHRVRRLVWADIADSSGTTQFLVLPHVDIYIKNQLLVDRHAYQQSWYGMRPYTDFYHRLLGATDRDPSAAHLNHAPLDSELEKLAVGWNSGLFRYDYVGLAMGKIWYRFPYIPFYYPRRVFHPARSRTVPVSCRIGTNYPRATIAAPRKNIIALLKGRIDTGKLPRRAYMRELRNSTAAISPFGLGEISLRDFECILAGAAVIKQDMSHLETWPSLWENEETYLPFSWDFSNFLEVIEYARSDPALMMRLATNAQNRYRSVLMTSAGHDEFCARFLNIVRPR
jgi:hypothetical protein